MKIKIRTTGFHLSLPVPMGMAGFVIRLLPESVFEKLRADITEPYCELVTKEAICMMVEGCLDTFKENKGLEIIHVEAVDGTVVSIRL